MLQQACNSSASEARVCQPCSAVCSAAIDGKGCKWQPQWLSIFKDACQEALPWPLGNRASESLLRQPAGSANSDIVWAHRRLLTAHLLQTYAIYRLHTGAAGDLATLPTALRCTPWQMGIPAMVLWTTTAMQMAMQMATAIIKSPSTTQTQAAGSRAHAFQCLWRLHCWLLQVAPW